LNLLFVNLSELSVRPVVQCSITAEATIERRKKTGALIYLVSTSNIKASTLSGCPEWKVS
jgi:hypothetical protein